jgi:hypothetical protein
MSVLFTFGTDGQTCENTFYLNDPTDVIWAAPAAVCAAVQNAVNTYLVPASYPNVKYIGVGIEDVRTFPFGGLEVPQAAVAGTRAGSIGALPSSCALAIKKVTGNLGRSGRGRWYWPLGDTNAISGSNDTVFGAYVTAILAALSGFQTDIETVLPYATVGIVSYRTGGAQRSVGLYQRISGWANTDATVDSQRRRLTGRGR